MVKNPPANTGDLRDAALIPGLERSTEAGNGNALQHFCLQNPMDKGKKKSIKKKKSRGQRSLAGYSSRGCKELDMTDRVCACACAHIRESVWIVV